MPNKLNQEELLRILIECFNSSYVIRERELIEARAHGRTKQEKWAEKKINEYKQALEQLESLIQRKPELPEKRPMTIEEIISKYPEQVKKFMIQGKVSREDIDKALKRFIKTYDIIEFEEWLKGIGITVEN